MLGDTDSSPTKVANIITAIILDVLHAVAWAKNILWICPCLSVCLLRFSYKLGSPHDPGSLLEHDAATMRTKVVAGSQKWSRRIT
jgi:hypothetical protein